MTDFSPPSGRPDRSPGAANASLWPVLLALVAVAALCGLVILRDRPSSGLIERVQSEPVPELAIAEIEPPPPPGAADFQVQPAASSGPEAASESQYDLALQLQRGDTVEEMLDDIGVPDADRKEIAEALKKLLKKNRLAVGETISLSLQTLPDAPDAPRVLSLLVRPRPEREYTITRNEDGSYTGEEKIYEVKARIVRAATRRIGSIQESGLKAGAPAQAISEFIKALSYDVDFQRELKSGQPFSLLLEQHVTSDGRVIHPGRLLAGELTLAKRTVTVIAFQPWSGVRQFYTPDGNSVVRAFLRTPMDASHISSRFGVRKHPILGYSAMHAGVDFAAPTGTPILAAGSGKVMTAGYYGGYGLYVELAHNSEIGTAYGHMSRLGPGIKRGVPVRQGQVIGFVGSTGMSTGPHLHYEFHRHGRAVNPLTQRASLRARLAGKDLAKFQGLVRQYRAKLKNAPMIGTGD